MTKREQLEKAVVDTGAAKDAADALAIAICHAAELCLYDALDELNEYLKEQDK